MIMSGSQSDRKRRDFNVMCPGCDMDVKWTYGIVMMEAPRRPVMLYMAWGEGGWGISHTFYLENISMKTKNT